VEVQIPLPSPGSPAVLTPAPQPVPSESPPLTLTPPPRRGGLPAYAWVGFSIAAGGFVVGSVSGLASFSKSKDLEASCPEHQCPQGSHGELDTARALGTVSNVAFGVGAIGLILGVTGAIVGRGDKATTSTAMTPWVGPTSVGLKGAF
jgi:hypothetical protein